MKILIALAFAGILFALASAGYAMLRSGSAASRDGGKSAGMMRALAWRVGISVTLFLAVLVAYLMGWIQPTGVPFR